MIAFLIWRVVEKTTERRAGSKFVGGCGKHVGGSTCNQKHRGGNRTVGAIEDMVGSEKLESFYGMAIEKMGDSVESLHPIGM